MPVSFEALDIVKFFRLGFLVMSKSYRFPFAVNLIVSTDGTIPKSISSPI